MRTNSRKLLRAGFARCPRVDGWGGEGCRGRSRHRRVMYRRENRGDALHDRRDSRAENRGGGGKSGSVLWRSNRHCHPLGEIQCDEHEHSTNAGLMLGHRLRRWPNPSAVELRVSIFHSFEGGIANADSNFKWRKKCLFMKNVHLQNVIIWLSEDLSHYFVNFR